MKRIKLSYLCLVFCSFHHMPTKSEEIITREKDREAIAAHILGIVNNVANLAKDPKDENEIGSNIVGLFTNILGCIFAASKRGDMPIDMNTEQIHQLIASLDQEVIEEIQKAVIKRSKQIHDL